MPDFTRSKRDELSKFGNSSGSISSKIAEERAPTGGRPRLTGREISGKGRTKGLALELRNMNHFAEQELIAAETPQEKRMAFTRLSNIRRLIRRWARGKRKKDLEGLDALLDE